MACLHYTSALATAAAGHTCRCSSTTTVAHLHHPQVARCRAHHCSAPRLLWPCQPSRHGVMTTAAGSGGAAGSSNNSESSGQLGFIQRWQRDSKQMQAQLQALGAAGVIAYGLFNTLYYTVAFVFVWFSIANVPSGLGFSAAARKAAEVFALVWAGSQVTKLARAGAALACAPLIDKGLDKLGLQDKRKAYLLIVLACVLLATAVMGCVIALHA